jgi:hypothetical protein
LAPHPPQALQALADAPHALQDATAGVVPATAAARPPLTSIMASAFFDLLVMVFSSGNWPKPFWDLRNLDDRFVKWCHDRIAKNHALERRV